MNDVFLRRTCLRLRSLRETVGDVRGNVAAAH